MAVNSNVTTVVQEVTDLRSEGAHVGQSSADLVGFYGATPVAQPSSASQGAVTATAVTSVNTTATITTAAHGFATGTQGDALVKRVSQLQVDSAAVVVLVNQLRSELVTLGLLKGA